MNDFMVLALNPDESGEGSVFSELKHLRRQVKDLRKAIEARDATIAELTDMVNDLTETATNAALLNSELLNQLDDAYNMVEDAMQSSESIGLLNADPEDYARFWFDPAGNPHPKVHTDRDYDCFDNDPTLSISKADGVQLKNVGKIHIPKKVSFSAGRKGFRIRFE